MRQLPFRVLYYGKDEPLPEQTQLRAGPLSMIFEAGDLRYIRLGSTRFSAVCMSLSVITIGTRYSRNSQTFRSSVTATHSASPTMSRIRWLMSISSGGEQLRGMQMGLSSSRWTGRHGQPSVATVSAFVCCTRWAVQAFLAVLRRWTGRLKRVSILSPLHLSI